MVARQRLSESTHVATERRLQRVERAAPIGFSSITRGGLRVQSPDGIQVHTLPGGQAGLRVTGLQVVDGTLRITGTLDGDGTWSWTGTLDQKGSTFLRGPVRITGASGTLEVEAQTFLKGVATLSADLIVANGGKVTAGNVSIEPNKITVGAGGAAATLQNGELTLANGAKLAVGLTGGASSIGLLPGGSADISANMLTAWMRAAGSTISVTTGQASISAPNIFMANLPTGAPAGAKAVLVDSTSGKLYRAT